VGRGGRGVGMGSTRGRGEGGWGVRKRIKALMGTIPGKYGVPL